MAEKFDFEKSIARLEEIVAVLEKGELPLDDMIKLYAEGTKIAGECNTTLEKAQLKISKLTQESEE